MGAHTFKPSTQTGKKRADLCELKTNLLYRIVKASANQPPSGSVRDRLLQHGSDGGRCPMLTSAPRLPVVNRQATPLRRLLSRAEYSVCPS